MIAFTTDNNQPATTADIRPGAYLRDGEHTYQVRGNGNHMQLYLVQSSPCTLAQAGTEARPDLAARMEKAAALVAAGAVKLNGAISHVNDYEVSPDSCTCKDFEYRAPDGWCKHRLAVRMAKALLSDELERDYRQTTDDLQGRY
jgi:hypothetical protein